MRLLFVMDHFGSGGAQRQMVSLAHGMVRRGHHVDFFVYHPDYRFFRPVVDELGVEVFETRKRGRLGLGVVRELRRCGSAGRYSAVLAFMETPSVYSELARLGPGSTPLVVSERVDPPAGRSSAQLRLRALLHRLADRVVANSHACRQDWCNRFPSLAGRFTTIWNGVDLATFSSVHLPARPSERLHAVAVGTLVPRKNAHGIVAAMIEIKRRNGVVPSVTWVGKTEETDQGRQYRATIENSLRAAGLAGLWTWAGERTHVAEILRGADLLLHASFREGLSNVICEALACGCPVLAADIGDNRLLIGDSERGALFSPADPADLADRLEEFSRLPPAGRLALRAEARAFAERELGLDRCVDRYEELFRSIARAP